MATMPPIYLVLNAKWHKQTKSTTQVECEQEELKNSAE